jgi:multisubunit Na+/H+ antiporter MnhB subunit
MDKKWLSKAAVIVACTIALLCTVFVLDAYNKGIEVPDRVWGLLGMVLMLIFGITLPTPGAKV